MKKKYLISRILIILILLIPFSLKLYKDSLEPYPAIILPGGGSTIKSFNEDFIVVKEYEIYLKLKSGKTKKIELNTLLKPMSQIAVRRILVKKDFWFNRKRTISKLKNNSYINPGQTSSPADLRLQDGIDWFRDYLGKTYNVDKEDIAYLSVIVCTKYKDIENVKRTIKKECKRKNSILLI